MRKPSNGALLLLAGMAMTGLYLMRDSVLNEPAPAFSLPDLAGDNTSLAAWRGRPLLLAFWTLDKPECRDAIHLLNRLAPDFRARGLEILTIKVGSTDGVADYLRDYQIALPTLVDWDASAAQAYGAGDLPRLVLIGADGIVKRTKDGGADESLLRDWLNSLSGS